MYCKQALCTLSLTMVCMELHFALCLSGTDSFNAHDAGLRSLCVRHTLQLHSQSLFILSCCAGGFQEVQELMSHQHLPVWPTWLHTCRPWPADYCASLSLPHGPASSICSHVSAEVCQPSSRIISGRANERFIEFVCMAADKGKHLCIYQVSCSDRTSPAALVVSNWNNDKVRD